MEIQRLKVEQANQAAGLAAAMRDSSNKLPPSGLMQPQPPSSDVEDPQLVAELHALRQRKSELEARMNDLQVSLRDPLMEKLDQSTNYYKRLIFARLIRAIGAT